MLLERDQSLDRSFHMQANTLFERRRRLQRTNTSVPGADLWVDTRSWGRVCDRFAPSTQGLHQVHLAEMRLRRRNGEPDQGCERYTWR
jgi:hypothetical protein